MYNAKLWQKKIFISTLTSLAPFFVMQIVSTGTGFTVLNTGHWSRHNNREEKSLRHIPIVAKFLDDNKPKIHLESEFALFQT